MVQMVVMEQMELTGAQGPAGNAATIAIGTVTTGAAGSSATVTKRWNI